MIPRCKLNRFARTLLPRTRCSYSRLAVKLPCLPDGRGSRQLCAPRGSLCQAEQVLQQQEARSAIAGALIVALWRSKSCASMDCARRGAMSSMYGPIERGGKL